MLCCIYIEYRNEHMKVKFKNFESNLKRNTNVFNKSHNFVKYYQLKKKHQNKQLRID